MLSHNPSSILLQKLPIKRTEVYTSMNFFFSNKGAFNEHGQNASIIAIYGKKSDCADKGYIYKRQLEINNTRIRLCWSETIFIEFLVKNFSDIHLPPVLISMEKKIFFFYWFELNWHQMKQLNSQWKFSTRNSPPHSFHLQISFRRP